MAERLIKLSPELLIHPGESLKEALEERNMSQEELAIRTGYSAKHISEVVRGKKDISHEFAERLEYALGIPSHFWMRLQENYDKEVFEINNVNSVTEDEIKVFDKLKEIVKYLEENNIIATSSKKLVSILNLRRFLNVNDLCSIEKLPIKSAAFRGSKKDKVDVNVLYAWLKLCEYYSSKNKIEGEYSKEKLLNNLDNIKNTMFLDANEMVDELKKIFSSIGISFCVVKNFKGAPVQGFIENNDDKIILCMTIRKSYSDIFWFTLFHEIGHILNNDFKDEHIDFKFEDNDIEKRADIFSRNYLINEDDYKEFTSKNNYSYESIKAFAKKENVIPSIVIGRIQREIDDYTFMAKYKTRYKWAE